MKLLLLLLAFLVIAPDAQAERDMYVLGTGEMPDQETQDKINRTRAEALRMRADAARSGYFFYNGDDGVYFGHGYLPRYNYNGYETRRGIADACSGLRARKQQRCVEDAVEAQQDLQKKYRD